MSETTTPWYVRWVIGVGAWVTAVVLMALGGAIVFSLLEIESISAFAYFGVVFFAAGIWFCRQAGSSIFAEQLGVATTAAGAAMVAIGFGGAAEDLWIGFVAATMMLFVVIALCNDRTIQFLVAMLALCFYVAAVLDLESEHTLDLIALATPLGLLLILFPPRRDMLPTAIAALMTFPVFSAFPRFDVFSMISVDQQGTIARILHIALFLGLVGLHLRNKLSTRATMSVVAFAVVAVLICLILPPGGSAAILILMLAFVVGSRPLALLGAALQSNFVVRYYYDLDMNLFDKSLLLMAVGALLIAVWWLLNRNDAKKSDL